MRKPCVRRSGFTLMEILLVVGVIAAFASMTLPPVLRMYGQRKLTESAERVRAVAASARVRAIESGLAYQFCCETNGTHFIAVPFEPDHASSGPNGSGPSGPSGQNGAPILLGRVSGRLPKGIVFGSVGLGTAGNVAVTTAPQKISPICLEGLPDANDLANLSWSPPILFNSDGSANVDAQIIVSDSQSQQITLRVRAFTGAVSMERLVAGKRR